MLWINNSLYSFMILNYWRLGEVVLKKEKSLKEKIQDFYKNGSRYEEKEIDFGKPKGLEVL